MICFNTTDNIWCTKPEEVFDIFLVYFQQLFSSSNPKIAETDLDSIPRINRGFSSLGS